MSVSLLLALYIVSLFWTYIQWVFLETSYLSGFQSVMEKNSNKQKPTKTKQNKQKKPPFFPQISLQRTQYVDESHLPNHQPLVTLRYFLVLGLFPFYSMHNPFPFLERVNSEAMAMKHLIGFLLFFWKKYEQILNDTNLSQNSCAPSPTGTPVLTSFNLLKYILCTCRTIVIPVPAKLFLIEHIAL